MKTEKFYCKIFAVLKKTDLEELPHRQWDTESEYDMLLFYLGKHKRGFWNNGKGYPYYELIGVDKDGTMEHAAHLDDLNIGDTFQYLIRKNNTVKPFRMDCSKGGVFRFWGNGIRFRVGHNTSSTIITLIEIEEGK